DWAETVWTTANARKFNLDVSGVRALTNFDVFVATGGANKAMAETFPAMSNASGQVVVAFTNGSADNALVEGLSVFSENPIVRINAGGSAVGPYIADADFSGGSTANHPNTITLTTVPDPAPAAVYQTQRFGSSFSYVIPNLDPARSYTVRM